MHNIIQDCKSENKKGSSRRFSIDYYDKTADVQQTTESYENRGEKQRILPQCENSGSPWFPIFAGMFSENSGSFPAVKTADDAEGTTNFSTKSYK